MADREPPTDESRPATSRGLKIVLVVLVGLALLLNWFLALLYFLAWAHYDGGGRRTEMLIAGWGAIVFIVPTLVCLVPSTVKLWQRLLVSVVTFAVGYLIMATHG